MALTVFSWGLFIFVENSMRNARRYYVSKYTFDKLLSYSAEADMSVTGYLRDLINDTHDHLEDIPLKSRIGGDKIYFGVSLNEEEDQKLKDIADYMGLSRSGAVMALIGLRTP